MKINTSFGELILLKYCPLMGMSERLEFLTEVHESYDGSEVRIPLRDQARQYFKVSYAALKDEIAKMINISWGGIRNDFAIPIYKESQLISSFSGDFIQCNTLIADLKVGLAAIYNVNDFNVIEIIEIGRYLVVDNETIYQDGIRIKDSISFSGGKLAPIRIAIIEGDINYLFNSFISKTEIMFRVKDNPEFIGDVPEQFKGQDLYFKPLLLQGNTLQVAIQQQQTIVDGELGVFTQFTNWNNPKLLRNMRNLIKSRQELREFKNWLFRCRGRLNTFWLPTYERNFNLVSTGIVTNWIDVKSDQYIDFSSDRKYLAIKICNVWSAHEITDAINSTSTTARLTLYPELYVDAKDIKHISYLGLHRIDNDAIEFNHKGGDCFEVIIPLLEIQP